MRDKNFQETGGLTVPATLRLVTHTVAMLVLWSIATLVGRDHPERGEVAAPVCGRDAQLI